MTHDPDWKAKLDDYVAFRNEVLRNPTQENALALWKRGEVSRTLGTPADQLVPLAGVHKARFLWRDATPAMLDESEKWLKEHGYKVPERLGPEHFIQEKKS